MTFQQLCSLIEVPTIALLWGQEYTITPRVLNRTFGDGGTLLRIAPIETRPMYYVIRVDSGWHLDCDCSSSVDYKCDVSTCLREHLDDIYEAMEGEFDELCPWQDDAGNEIDCDQAEALGTKDPHSVLEMGTCWDVLEWPKVAA